MRRPIVTTRHFPSRLSWAGVGLFLLCVASCRAGIRPVSAPLVSAALREARPIEVLLLGTFHFTQTDTTTYDVLSSVRAAEVDAVVASLVHWHPDKLFVEWQPEFNQMMADSLLEEHRTTGPLRRRNEVYQLGIRTAVRLEHPRVYLMDHPGLYGALYAPMESFARSHGQADVLEGRAAFSYRADYEERATPHAPRDTMTLAAYLQLVNSPRSLASDHSVYLSRFARIGEIRTDLRDTAGVSTSGAALVADWYRRNVQMYSKVLKWMTFGERRIVIIVGSSHVPILRHLFETHGGFRVVEVSQVLPRS
jgi:Family of unknown function (DUF5694)